MGKIKLNLVSGAVVEKPLISAFKANNSNYVVLDNEMNGSMGLPIILVCKYENNKLTKILDQNEWGIVKEYLKNIIAGNQIEFINIQNEIAADDIYYTQLTLPVPSFDALKSAYKVEEVVTEIPVSQVVSEEVAIEQPVMDIPSVDVVMPVTDIPQVEVPMEPTVQIEESVVSTNEPVVDIPMAPQYDIPVVEPVMPNVEVPQGIEPIQEPEITPTPVIEPVMPEQSAVSNEDMNIFKEQKEAFMQACENMFDALVQRFERELENRK